MIKVNGSTVIGERDEDGSPVVLFSNDPRQPTIDRIVDISSPTSTSNTRVEFSQVSAVSGTEYSIPSEFFRENAADIHAALTSAGAYPPRVTRDFGKRFQGWVAGVLPARTHG